MKRTAASRGILERTFAPRKLIVQIQITVLVTLVLLLCTSHRAAYAATYITYNHYTNGVHRKYNSVCNKGSTYTWVRAAKRCTDTSSQLASYDASIATSVAVSSVSGETDIWVGLDDNANEGYFVWSYGRFQGMLQTSRISGVRSCYNLSVSYPHIFDHHDPMTIYQQNCNWVISQPDNKNTNNNNAPENCATSTISNPRFNDRECDYSGERFTCHLCEQSSCQHGVDYNQYTSTSIGMYPCTVTCGEGYEGPNCRVTSNGHLSAPLNVSVYQVVRISVRAGTMNTTSAMPLTTTTSPLPTSDEQQQNADDESYTYDDAVATCGAMESGKWHIATFSDDDALALVMNQFKIPRARDAWIGASDEVSEGQWVWQAGRLAGNTFYTQPLDNSPGTCATTATLPSPHANFVPTPRTCVSNLTATANDATRNHLVINKVTGAVSDRNKNDASVLYVVCERSLCVDGLDYNSKTATANSLYFPCDLVCKDGYSGERCDVYTSQINQSATVAITSVYTAHCSDDGAGVTYATAAAQCAAVSGRHLATFPQQAQFTGFSGLLAVAPFPSAMGGSRPVSMWIGGSDAATESVWVWAPGSRIGGRRFARNLGSAGPTPIYYNPVGSVLHNFSFSPFSASWVGSDSKDCAYMDTPTTATDRECGGTAQCWACERSPCSTFSDCVHHATESLTANSTNFPDCWCTCKAGHSGRQCEITTVEHGGAYTSEYVLQCRHEGYSFAEGEGACAARNGIDVGAWRTATFPSAASLAAFGANLQYYGQAAWIAATSGGSAVGDWRWTRGRLADQLFSQNAVRQPVVYQPTSALRFGFAATDGPLWDAGRPTAGPTNTNCATTNGSAIRDELCAPNAALAPVKCVACERSPCAIGIDCSAGGTENVTGYFGYCRCACRRGFDGPRCERVHHGDHFVSEYDVVCDPTAAPKTFSGAAAACQSRGVGWDLASMPNQTVASVIAAQQSAYPVWVGAVVGNASFEITSSSPLAVPRRWQWSGGRLAGYSFSELSGPCLPLHYHAVGATVLSFTGCPWASGEPSAALVSASSSLCASTGLSSPSDRMRAVDCGDSAAVETRVCYACERSPCNINLDCVAGATESLHGEYYPHCVCVCKQGYGGKRCDRATVLHSTGDTPSLFYQSEYEVVCERRDDPSSSPAKRQSIDYAAARHFCQNRPSSRGTGWDLATFPSRAAIDAVAPLVGPHANTANVWVGAALNRSASDVSARTQWQWTSGRLQGLFFYDVPSASCLNVTYVPVGARQTVFSATANAPCYFPALPALSSATTSQCGVLSTARLGHLGAQPCDAAEYSSVSSPMPLPAEQCFACERSPCNISIDCNVPSTDSMSGDYYPNCVCHCVGGFTGARCERTVVDQGPYVSEYDYMCDLTSPTSIDEAERRCRSRDDGHGGWALATFPTAYALHAFSFQLHAAFGSTWIGAMDNITEGSWYWTSGRLRSTPFYSAQGGPHCVDTPFWSPLKAVHIFSDCMFNLPSAPPVGGVSMNCGGISPSPPHAYLEDGPCTNTASSADAASPKRCYACERSPCQMPTDCQPSTTVSMSDYFPCTCACEQGYDGDRCQWPAIASHGDGAHASHYRLVRAPPLSGGVSYSGAEAGCRALGIGWSLATFPTAHSLAQYELALGGSGDRVPTWVGARRGEASEGQARFWRWDGGRLSDQQFYAAGRTPLPTAAPAPSTAPPAASPTPVLTPRPPVPTVLPTMPSTTLIPPLTDPSTVPTTKETFVTFPTTVIETDPTTPGGGSGRRFEAADAADPTDSVCERTPLRSIGGGMPHHYFQHCPWNVNRPLASTSFPGDNSNSGSTSPFCGTLQISGPFGRMLLAESECGDAQLHGAYACERSPCDVSIDCYEPNTVSVSGGFYPNCVCACKAGKGGKHCAVNVSLSASASVPATRTVLALPVPTGSLDAEHTATAAPLGTLSMTLAASGTVTRALSSTIMPDIPVLWTTLSKLGYGPLRYFVHTPVPLTEQHVGSRLYSGIPIVFTQHYASWHVRRLLETSATQSALRLPLVVEEAEEIVYVGEDGHHVTTTTLSPTAMRADTLFPNSSVSIAVAMSRTAKSSPGDADSLVLNGVLMEDFVSPLDPTAPVEYLTDAACLSLATSATIVTDRAAAAAGLDVDGAELSPATSHALNAPIREWSLAVGLLLRTPYCRAGIAFAGLAYSSVPFASSPSLAYVFNPAQPSQGLDYFMANVWNGDVNALADWSRPTSLSFSIVGENTAAVLVGNLRAPTAVPAPATAFRMQLIAPIMRRRRFVSLSSSSTNTSTAPASPNATNSTSVTSSSSSPAGDFPLVRIAPDTHRYVACAVGDQRSFPGTPIRYNASFTPAGTYAECYMFDTVDDLHLACLGSDDCVGFTTIEIDWPYDRPVPKELPLCMVMATQSTAPSATKDIMPYRRMFYAKPRPPTCSVRVEQPGTVAVYVQQTAMARGTVVVRANGVAKAVCGGTNPFANGYYGTSGRCNLWALCYTGYVPSNSTVSITPTSLFEQNGCANSLGVMVEQTSGEYGDDYHSPRVPPVRYVLSNGSTSAPREVRKVTRTHNDPIRLFVFKGEVAALDVMQTNHEPRRVATVGYPVTAETTISLSTSVLSSDPSSSSLSPLPPSCQLCGGLKGFHGGIEGYSDMCDEYQYCAGPLTLNASSGVDSAVCATNGVSLLRFDFSGVLLVKANLNGLTQMTDACTGFLGQVSVARRPGAPVSVVPHFPLITTDGRGEFSTLIGVPAGQPVPAPHLFHHYASSSASAPTPTRILTTGPRDARLDVYYVPEWSASHMPQEEAQEAGVEGEDAEERISAAPPSRQEQVPTSSTQVCIVDHSLERAAQCIFYVPKGATHVTVKGAQTDFATKSMTVSIYANANRTEMLSSDVCGQSKFGNFAGRQQACDTYTTCTHRFIYPDDAMAETNSEATVVVDLPAGMRCYNCDFVAVIIAEFTKSDLEPVECDPVSEFECVGDRRCIPVDQVCDGITDCEGGSDEDKCSELSTMVRRTFCVYEHQLSHTYNDSYIGCLRTAMRNQTSIFRVNATQCTIVNGSASSTIIALPNEYLCRQDNADDLMTTYMVLPRASRAMFGLCLSSVQCHGNGVANIDNATGSCVCACDEGYTGEWCDAVLRLEDVTEVACLLDGSQPSVPVAVVADALRLDNYLVQIECSSVSRGGALNKALLRVMCTARSIRLDPADVAAHHRQLLRFANWAAINATLIARGLPSLHSISGRSFTTPEVEMPPCTTTVTHTPDGSTANTRCAVTSAYDRLRIIVDSNVSVVSLRVSVRHGLAAEAHGEGQAGHSRLALLRGFEGASTAMAATAVCAMASTGTDGGCVRSSCDVPFSGSAGDVLVVEEVVYSPRTLFTVPCAPTMAVDGLNGDDSSSTTSIRLAAQVSIGNVETYTNLTAQLVQDRREGFIIGGTLLLTIGAVAAWTAAALVGIRAYRLRARVFRNNFVSVSHPYYKLRADMLTWMWSINRAVVRKQGIHGERWASGLGIIGAIFSFGSALLMILYTYEFGVETNFSVMYEEFSDADCQGSTTGYMPRRILSVDPAARGCAATEAAGEAAGVTYAYGWCLGLGGSYTVKDFHMGASKTACTARQGADYPSDACMPLRDLDPQATRDAFVKLTCSSAEKVQERFGRLRQLSTRPDVFVDGQLMEPSPRVAWGDHLASIPFIAGTTLKHSTTNSHHGVGGDATTAPSLVLATQASSSEFDGDYDALRIVLQVPHCVGAHPTSLLATAGAGQSSGDSGPSTCTSPTESSMLPAMNTLNSLQADPADLSASASYGLSLAPNVPDSPVGYVFGGFGTDRPETWSGGAGKTAQRYYGARGSPFDMGLFLSPSKADRATGDGYTVSMWLRADTSTLGFAYAVTDAFEDSKELRVVTLDRLARIIDGSGSGQSDWFETTYQVYHALYVNGPGRTLVFAHASPSLPARVEMVVFDLDEIGQSRVMNGHWHHVAVTFRVENGKVIAQLVVDGKSSTTDGGWSTCVGDLPSPITDVPSAASAASFNSDTSAPASSIRRVDNDGDGIFTTIVPVFNPITDRVTRGGMIVVGYLNGGVYRLRADTKPMVGTDFLAEGTGAMRDANEFPETAMNTMAVLLLVVACLLFVIVVLHSASAFMDTRVAISTSAYHSISGEFYEQMWQIAADCNVDRNSTRRWRAVPKKEQSAADRNNGTSSILNSVELDTCGLLPSPAPDAAHPAQSAYEVYSSSDDCSSTSSCRLGYDDYQFRYDEDFTEQRHRRLALAGKAALAAAPQENTANRDNAENEVGTASSDDEDRLVFVDPISFQTCLRWLNVSCTDFAALVQDLKDQSGAPHLALANLLYCAMGERCVEELSPHGFATPHDLANNSFELIPPPSDEESSAPSSDPVLYRLSRTGDIVSLDGIRQKIWAASKSPSRITSGPIFTAQEWNEVILLDGEVGLRRGGGRGRTLLRRVVRWLRRRSSLLGPHGETDTAPVGEEEEKDTLSEVRENGHEAIDRHALLMANLGRLRMALRGAKRQSLVQGAAVAVAPETVCASEDDDGFMAPAEHAGRREVDRLEQQNSMPVLLEVDYDDFVHSGLADHHTATDNTNTAMISRTAAAPPLPGDPSAAPSRPARLYDVMMAAQGASLSFLPTLTSGDSGPSTFASRSAVPHNANAKQHRHSNTTSNSASAVHRQLLPAFASQSMFVIGEEGEGSSSSRRKPNATVAHIAQQQRAGVAHTAAVMEARNVATEALGLGSTAAAAPTAAASAAFDRGGGGGSGGASMSDAVGSALGHANLSDVSVSTPPIGSGISEALSPLVPQLWEHLAPLLASIQLVSVWITSVGLPETFRSTFADFFSFMAFDFTSAFAGVSALVTPILHTAAALAVVGLLCYCLLEDNRAFSLLLARYVWRRDEMAFRQEEANSKKKKKDAVSRDMAPSLLFRGDEHFVPLEPLEKFAICADKFLHDDAKGFVRPDSPAAEPANSDGGSAPRHDNKASSATRLYTPNPLHRPLTSVGGERRVGVLPRAMALAIDVFRGRQKAPVGWASDASGDPPEDEDTPSASTVVAPRHTSHLLTSTSSSFPAMTRANAKDSNERVVVVRPANDPVTVPTRLYGDLSFGYDLLPNEQHHHSDGNNTMKATDGTGKRSRVPPKDDGKLRPLLPLRALVAAPPATAQGHAGEGSELDVPGCGEPASDTLPSTVVCRTARHHEGLPPTCQGASDRSSPSDGADAPFVEDDLDVVVAFDDELADDQPPVATPRFPSVTKRVAWVEPPTPRESAMPSNHDEVPQSRRRDEGIENIAPVADECHTQHEQQGQAPRRAITLSTVGVYCPDHPLSMLTPLHVQTKVWPPENRLTCCIEGCGADQGQLYSCGCVAKAAVHAFSCQGEAAVSGDDPSTLGTVCTYALCETHFRPMGLREKLFGRVMAKLRRIRHVGVLQWLGCTAAFALVDAIYIPCVKTALMIISCHSYARCEFGDACWDRPSSTFIAAAAMAICVLAVLGLGVPLALFWSLRRRGRQVAESSGAEEALPAANDEAREARRTREWSSFLQCDTTVLGGKYVSIDVRWLYFPAILYVTRLVQLLPTVLVEPRSLTQWLVTLRVAEVYRTAVLGLTYLEMVQQNKVETTAAKHTAATIVAVTVLYLMFSVAVALLTFVWPVLSGMLSDRRLKAILAARGLSYGKSTSLYREPTPDDEEEIFVLQKAEAYEK